MLAAALIVALAGTYAAGVAEGVVPSPGAKIAALARKAGLPASVSALLDARSPGERLAGALSNKKPLQKAPPVEAAEPPAEGAGPPAAPGAVPNPLVAFPGDEALGAPLVPDGVGPHAAPPVEAAEAPSVAAPNAPGFTGGVGPVGLAPPAGGGGGVIPPTGPGGTTPTSPIPEPAAWLTMLIGFAVLGGAARARTLRRRTAEVTR